jgi:hypothetical protein
MTRKVGSTNPLPTGSVKLRSHSPSKSTLARFSVRPHFGRKSCKANRQSVAELHEFIPTVSAQFLPYKGLHLFPVWERPPKLRPSGARQPDPPFPAVLAAAPCDPAVPAHDRQSSGQRGAVHGEELPHLSLCHFASQGKHLQYGELRRSQA